MIIDSGKRTRYDTGAVRDIQTGKGRCDLLPLDVIADFMEDPVLDKIASYENEGDEQRLFELLDIFCPDKADAVLELAKHFEEGAEKYGERNWEKGIPARCYIDSAIRHYLKWKRGDDDERHDRAFMWNIVCLIWTERKLEEDAE